jgi:acetate kinase
MDTPLKLPAGRALSLNSGSSSLKAATFVDGTETARRNVPAPAGEPAALERAVDEVLEDLDCSALDVVGHRVVHGGAHLHSPTIIDDAVVDEMNAATALAPLHQPAALAVIAATRSRLPNAPQVACFDTDFHWRLPELSTRLPIPGEYAAAGIRRYGFHGLSYEYVVRTLGADLPARAVIAHLGNGSSMVALRNGVPVDTTMGLTPGGGLVMSTRSGDIDPGIAFALTRLVEGDVEAVAHMLEERSGLLALSGTSGDLARLVEASRAESRARFAVESYVRSAAQHAAALIVVLHGLDQLVFTGGVGTHNEVVRASITAALVFAGFDFDVRIVPTDEERMIAYHALRLAADAES